MKTSALAFLATPLCAAVAIGCGSDLVVPSEPAPTTTGTDTAALHDTHVAAHAEILRSQATGTELLAKRLDAVLGSQGVVGFDARAASAAVGNAAPMLYVQATGARCPFLRDPGPVGVACTALAEQAVSDVLLLDQAAEEAAIDRRATDLRAPLGEDGVRFVAMYGKAALENGLDAGRTRVLQALRVAGKCDTRPDTISDAYVYGTEEGERLFQTASAATLQATPRTICDVDQIASAARDAASAQVDGYLSGTPICPGVDLATLQARVDFAQATPRRKSGVHDGIEGAYQNFRIWLVRNWVCQPPTSINNGATWGDPIVVDLDGSGIRFSASRVRFDLYDDGQGVWMPTLAPGSAYLARDLDGDGVIGSGAELVTNIVDGLARDGALPALRALDRDGDGTLDRAETAAARLVLWRDANGDGACQKAELLQLADQGFDHVSLRATEGYAVDGLGDVFRQSISLGGARTARAVDVWLAVEADALPAGTALAPPRR